MRTMLAAWISNYLTKHKNSEVVREFSHRKMLTKKIQNQYIVVVAVLQWCVAGFNISYLNSPLYYSAPNLASLYVDVDDCAKPKVSETNKLELPD